VGAAIIFRGREFPVRLANDRIAISKLAETESFKRRFRDWPPGF
jgi:hypothetical protein